MSLKIPVVHLFLFCIIICCIFVSSVRTKKDIPDSPASPTSPEPPKPNTVTVRQHSTINNATNNVSNHPPPVTVAARPQSVHSEVPATRQSGPGSRPSSMYSPANDKLSTPPSNSIPSDATVSMKQFLELVEKVGMRELSFTHADCH